MWVTVGITSFDDWHRFTWSLGCTGFLAPRSNPRLRLARLAMTSLAFMLVEVPDPVWKMSRGKWASWSPRMTSSAAAWMAPAELFVQQAELPVGPGRRPLDQPERHQETAAEPPVGDREVVDRPLGLGAVEGRRRDLHLAHAVRFDPLGVTL